MDEGRVQRRGEKLVAVLRGDVDEIAEHVVVPDFERPHAGRLGVAHLQRGDDAARLIAQRARLVERRLVSGADETAVAAERRQFVGQRSRQFGGDGRIGPAQRRDRFGDIARHLRQRREPGGKFHRGENPVTDRGEIARAAAADHDARQRPRQIGHGFERAA